MTGACNSGQGSQCQTRRRTRRGRRRRRVGISRSTPCHWAEVIGVNGALLEDEWAGAGVRATGRMAGNGEEGGGLGE